MVAPPAKDLSFYTREELQARIAELEDKKEREAGLPHLYGWSWYAWAWEFFNSKNRYNFLCAANQISKSSTMIRKCIHWATCKELWPTLWKRTPTQFWYLYPSLEVATVEFREKWVKEFLPRGEYKNHPLYGWKENYGAAKKIHSIEFNSGVTVYFRSYEQDIDNLQTSSVYAIFCDEELPEHLYSELNARISAASIRGYWHMAFTATIGQEIWRLTMEERGTKDEKYPKAAKWQVSMYDCKTYMDGSPSPVTDEIIQETIDSCATPNEVLRRVWGRFVVDTDLKYPSFSRKENVKPNHPLPKGWLIFAGVDIGSGGQKGHPSAICFVGVNPSFTAGRVFKAWRGDKIETTAGDVVNKYIELRGKMRPVGQYYDHQCRDFYTVAISKKLPFQKAEKGQDTGANLLNTLFKMKMLAIYDDDPDLKKLVIELGSLKTSTPKPKAKDDLIDALRFAVSKIPWDFDSVAKSGKVYSTKEYRTEREKHWAKQKDERDESGLDLIAAEIDLANEAFDYGGGDEDPFDQGYGED